MMNILMSGNDHVYPGMELAIYSTLTHNKGIKWYIFTMEGYFLSINDRYNYIIYKKLNAAQNNHIKLFL